MNEPLDIYAKIQDLVKKEIDDKINAYANNSKYIVAQVPAHTHNGVDSNRIDSSDLEGSVGSFVPTTRTVNGHALSADVTVTNADLGAVPTTRTVNGHALSSNVTVTASDIGRVDNIGLGSVASDNLRVSADTEEQSIGASINVLAKQIKIYKSGVIRVKADFKRLTGFSGSGYFGINGVSTGVFFTDSTTNYVTTTTDLTISFGDIVQVYISGGQPSSHVYTQNFRVYYDYDTLVDQVLQN